jgi:hypothetical protein
MIVHSIAPAPTIEEVAEKEITGLIQKLYDARCLLRELEMVATCGSDFPNAFDTIRRYAKESADDLAVYLERFHVEKLQRYKPDIFSLERAQFVISEIDAGHLTWDEAIERNMVPIVYTEESLRRMIEERRQS